MGGLFTDSNIKIQLAPSSAEWIYNPTIKPGTIGEMSESLLWAENTNPGHGYGAWATQALTNLAPSVNTYGLWDANNGGYWSQVKFNTNSSSMNINSPGLTYTIDTSYKEVGRFTVVVRAFMEANAIGAADISAPTCWRKSIRLRWITITAAGHGWPYQRYGNWTLYNDPPLQIWVTSEAIGHAVRSILSYELGQ